MSHGLSTIRLPARLFSIPSPAPLRLRLAHTDIFSFISLPSDATKPNTQWWKTQVVESPHLVIFNQWRINPWPKNRHPFFCRTTFITGFISPPPSAPNISVTLLIPTQTFSVPFWIYICQSLTTTCALLTILHTLFSPVSPAFVSRLEEISGVEGIRDCLSLVDPTF